MQTATIVKIGKDSYDVSYPNVGQKLDIENVKLMLTNSQYGEMARSGHVTALQLLDLVDAVAYFTILVPELKSSLKVQDFMDMNPVEARNLRKGYKKYFVPFFEAVEKELNEDGDEDETTEV